MKLSIIIVNFNTKDLTLKCLKSLEKYPFREKFEVLLIDNASDDGSKKVFEKFRSKKYMYKYIYNASNFGFAKANNIGINKSSGQNILLLNSDTEVTKDALNNLVDFAQSKNDAGVVGSKLLNSDKTPQASVFRLPTIVRAISQYWLGNKNILDKYYPKGNDSQEVEAVVGASFLITPKAVKNVGSLDGKYFMYFEDLDYCRKVKKAGLKVYYLPESKIIHHHGASGGDWRKLVDSSKLYHGELKHYIIFLITWIGQKKEKLFGF